MPMFLGTKNLVAVKLGDKDVTKLKMGAKSVDGWGAPSGFVMLVGADGSALTGADGSYLYGKAQ